MIFISDSKFHDRITAFKTHIFHVDAQASFNGIVEVLDKILQRVALGSCILG
jgi:hypothetical protein